MRALKAIKAEQERPCLRVLGMETVVVPSHRSKPQRRCPQAASARRACCTTTPGVSSRPAEPPCKARASRVSSLRLTVTLLALAMFLILAGTFAQIDHPINVVQKLYFHSFFVWAPFQLFLPRPAPGHPIFPGRLPMPVLLVGGGLVVGVLALLARGLGDNSQDVLFSGQSALPWIPLPDTNSALAA